MPRRNFQGALREADQILAGRDMPLDVDRRLRQRLAQGRQGLRSKKKIPLRLAVPVAVAAAAVAAVVMVANLKSRSRQPAELGGLVVLEQSNDFQGSVRDDQVIEIRKGGCILMAPASGSSFVVRGRTALRSEARGVRVVRGEVEVEVEKRRPDAPARVLVSHGTIEVLGTRFAISQGETSGSVVLHEGSIRFTATDGRVMELKPGETQDWPLAPSKAESQPASPIAETTTTVSPPPEPSTRKRSVAAADPVAAKPAEEEPVDLNESLEQIAALRSRRQYTEAVQELERMLARPLSGSTAERLSFELGSILTYQLSVQTRSCAHWVEHEIRFPSGRYQVEIAQARRHLKCVGMPQESER